jgi:hypothetical protein
MEPDEQQAPRKTQECCKTGLEVNQSVEPQLR